MSNSLLETLLQNSVNPQNHIIDRYIKFINNCQKINFVGYTEKHHIIPKSFGGDNSKTNLIDLSAKHHYVAHLLLAKATTSPKMIKALHKMLYSTKGDVQRNYKITSRVYAYVREEHAKIVSAYSKNTVVAKHLITNEVKRIPKKLFEKYNGILYKALAKGRVDSLETTAKKQKASQRPRTVKQGTTIRSVAASIYSYQTPKGYCKTSKELLNLYPSFTRNTLTVVDNDVIITNKFASLHPEFKNSVGKTFEETGIIKSRKNCV